MTRTTEQQLREVERRMNETKDQAEFEHLFIERNALLADAGRRRGERGRRGGRRRSKSVAA
jgi:hypothetical protein